MREVLSHFVLEIASCEISRILFHLNISTSHNNKILVKFKKLWVGLDPRHTFRDPELLPPLIIYFYCKLNEISIDTESLLDISRIPEDLFVCLVFQIIRFFITERRYTLSDFQVESEYWFEDFNNFLQFLSIHTHCSLCQRSHRREYLIAFYFNIKPAFRDKFISNTNVHIKCISKKSCIFLKDDKCKIGVPCNKCCMEYFRKKDSLKIKVDKNYVKH